MRVINTSVNTLSTRYLVIGFEGENERTQIRIDAASVFDEYPQASPSMAVKPGFGEEVYPVIVTKEGNEVVWDVTQDNLDFTGDGEIQLTFIKDNVICKTTIGKIRVNRSLIVNGDPPEHLDTWYEEATAKLADVDAAVYSLEALDATASGLPAGASPTVEVQDVNDHKRLAFGIPKGDRGDRGATGNGIRSISQSGSTGLYKKYTIHYTDGTTTTFQVRDGDRGLKGDTGATPDISIGTVETLPAGSEATASMSGTAENPRLNLGIPKGDQGIQGEKGDKGDRGATPVFSMGAVTNLPAGSSATATITGTAEEPVLNLGIPKGDKGDKGDRGERGPQGIQGIQGDRGLTGPRGEQGQKGDKGDTGAAGATGATPDLSIGTVSTLPAGSSATAEITGTPENPVLSLGIPQGVQGIQGEKGEKGDPGEGVPTGGLKGQVLAKASDTDYDTEWIHVAPVIKNTASGSIASFADGADGHPVDELKVSIEPVQDLHGYENPWPGGGGVNKIDVNQLVSYGTTYGLTTSFDGDWIVLSGEYTSTNQAANFRIAQLRGLTVFPVTKFKAFPDSNTSSHMSSAPFGLADGNKTLTIYISDMVQGETYNLRFKIVGYEGDTAPTEWTPYSNICPITGHTGAQIIRNAGNYATMDSVMEGYALNSSGATYPETGMITTDYMPVGQGDEVNFYFVSKQAARSRRVIGYNKDKTFNSILYESTWVTVGYTIDNTYTIQSGIAFVRASYYSGDVNKSLVNKTYESVYPISWQTEAGTVYGGELTVAEDGTGALVVGWKNVDLGTLTWIKTTASDYTIFYTEISDKALNVDFVSSHYKNARDIRTKLNNCEMGVFNTNSEVSLRRVVIRDDVHASDTTAEFQTAMSGVQLVYKLATPITYTLTASQIRTLLGHNNIWADTGDVSVKYNADTKLYIDNKITQAIAAALNS